MDEILKERFKAIQRAVGVDDDGALGPVTVAALERALKLSVDQRKIASLTVPSDSVRGIISFEIGDRGTYDRNHARPGWPGAASGVTVGIGYDLGYHDVGEIRSDFGSVLSASAVNAMASVSGITGVRAKAALASSSVLRDIVVPYGTAERVFAERTLPKYAAATVRAFPGVERLPPRAQGALLSLVFNRGEGMDGERRSEMREVRDAVARGDLRGIADAISRMKRLWAGTGMGGLLRRRDWEASEVLASIPVV